MALKKNAAEVQTEESTDRETPAAPGSMEIELEPERPENDDDDDDDDDPAPKPEATPEGKKKTRQRERGRAHRELQDELRAERERREALEGRLNQLSGYVQARQAPPEDPTRPIQTELEQVNEEQQQIWQQASALGDKLTAEQYKALNKKASDLELRKHRLMSRLVQVESNEPQQQRLQVEQQVMRAQLNTRYPDLVDTQAGQWGMLRYQQMLAEGKRPGWETLDEAAEEARRQYGMASRSSRQPPPTRVEQRRLEGAPKGGGGGPNTDQPRKVRLTKEQLFMAEAWNPSLAKKDPNKCYQEWWNTIGKKHA